MPAPDRNKMYRVVIYTGASLLTMFALVGQELLALFGISLPSFEMAGRPPLLLPPPRKIFPREKFSKTSPNQEKRNPPTTFPLLPRPPTTNPPTKPPRAHSIL